MNKKYNVRPIILIFVIIVLIVSTVLILSKMLDDNEQPKSKKEIEQSEIIRVISEDNTMMIDNVIIEKQQSQKHLIFDVVRLDKTIENVKFNVVLSYDGDPVFENEVVIYGFSNDSINKKIKLENFKYDLDQLSVVIENLETNNMNN